jgi:hypothetical protein
MTVEQLIELLTTMVGRGSVRPTAFVVIDYEEISHYLYIDEDSYYTDSSLITTDRLILKAHT